MGETDGASTSSEVRVTEETQSKSSVPGYKG